VHYLLRNPISVAELAGELLPICEKLGVTIWQMMGEVHLAWARSHLPPAGGEETPSELAAHGFEGYRASGARLELPYFLCHRAEILSREGRITTALEALDEALSIIEITEDRFWEPEIRRFQGELLLSSRGDGNGSSEFAAEAERRFRRALELARKQASKLLELRVAVSWGRLLRARGEEAAARELVNGVFRAFTEGFEAPDLVQARAFLAAPS